MERTAREAEVHVGNNLYTNLDYTDDVVLMGQQTETLRSALTKFYQTVEDLGLHLSWQKTKVQNLDSGDSAADITVANNTIELGYLGFIQSSSGRCYLDLHRRTGVASSAMHQMRRCWRQRGLSLETKLRLYQTCVLQILLYGADTLTLLADDTRRLQSYYVMPTPDTGCEVAGPCEKNVHIADRTGLPNIADIISKRRQALFGDVVRLDATTPAHEALWQVIAMKDGQSPGINWRRPPGRPRKTWIQQIGNGTPASWRQM